MPITTKFKSKDYLNYIATKPCCVTHSKHQVDCHHESICRNFSGSLKKYFDFGTLPLQHKLHIDTRHQLGRKEFWSHYNLDPKQLVIGYLKEYINLNKVDAILAQEALELIEGENL